VAEQGVPGMVDRTVFVGSNLQVMVRLATGAMLQASVPNEGEGLDRYRQGSPVTVRIPADALRVLSGTWPRLRTGACGVRSGGSWSAGRPRWACR
jgi:hypothetical protein